MAKEDKHRSEPMPATGCVVCGSYGVGPGGGALPDAPATPAGAGPRWHAECETARPDVIRKVKKLA